ncbi:MAG: hypothetical protein ABIR98_07215, partial [Usitatibacter sp.]
GGVQVQCSGTTNPPPTNAAAETFVMSTASISAQANSVANFAVQRSGGSGAAFGPTTVQFSYSGSGCAITGTYPVAFAAGQMSSPIGTPLAGSGTCAATLVAPPSPGVLGSPSSTVITLPGGGSTPPPGCPAAPQDMLSATFAGLGNPLLQMQRSGQVVQIPLPSMTSSGQVTFGESAGGAYTPQPVTLEVSINKCPGVIDTDYTNRCNIRSTNGNYNSITWLAKTYQGRGGNIDSTTANANGLCWGGDTGSQYYINARWSYSSCAFGAQVCGFAIQYNLGGY